MGDFFPWAHPASIAREVRVQGGKRTPHLWVPNQLSGLGFSRSRSDWHSSGRRDVTHDLLTMTASLIAPVRLTDSRCPSQKAPPFIRA